MSEIIKKMINDAKAKNRNIIIYQKNQFRFEGKIISSDDRFIEFHDAIKDKIKIISISQIAEMEVK